MAKRPLLTIEIPSGGDTYENVERVHEVSCFSPSTPDDESCESESASSSTDYTRGERVTIAAQDSDDAQSMSNRSSEDEMDESEISMVRIGSRWSRLYQHSSLQSVIVQAHLTPTRRKRRSATSVLPISAAGSASNRCSPLQIISTRRSPSQKIVHSTRRRRSNPFDCFGSHRYSQVCTIDQVTTPLGFLPAVNSPLPLDVSDNFSTPKLLRSSTRRTGTC